MTIAIDRVSGAVVGQYLGEYVKNAELRMVPTHQNRIGDYVKILTRGGYTFFPRRSVRLEEIR